MAAAPALDSFLEASPSLVHSLRGIERAAKSDSPVLVVGEPGTGRSTLARALYAASDRSQQPLVEVDIAAIPSSLFESEFFGYRRGAFTGAESSSMGRVERAKGGVLVLDQVEELPINAQPKLLRLLAEQRFTPLGGSERGSDVRFVAVGAEDLEQRVRAGGFRRDLFHRLDVLRFRIPPLRERRSDLPTLLEFLLADLGERLGKEGLSLSDSAWQWMVEYGWPGNLRQLRNVLERETVMNSETVILSPEAPSDLPAIPKSLAVVEREQIVAALAYTKGHQSKAAELLGISRKTLWEKRRRYDIP